MTPQRPETARLLASRGSLIDDLRQAIKKALEENMQQPPIITVKSSLGDPSEIQAAAPGVFIGRPKAAEKPPQTAPGGEIQVWVRQVSISPKHVEISRSPAGHWVVSSLGRTPVRIEVNGQMPATVNQGENREIPADRFRLRIGACMFDFESKPGAREKIGDVVFATPKPGGPTDPCTSWFAILGIWFELRWPRDLGAGRSGQVRLAVQSVWEGLCERCAIPAARAVAWSDAPPSGQPGEQESRFASVAIDGKERPWEVRIPVPFYDLLWRKLMETGVDQTMQRLERGIGWWRSVTVGEQTVPLDRLKELIPGSVIVLERNSASILDPVFWERRRLFRETAGAGPVPKAAFRIGEMVPQKIRWRAAATNDFGDGENGMQNNGPDTGSIGVKIEVVLPAKKLTISDLNKWKPGEVIEAELKEGTEVGIAINGEVMGRGKIVPAPGDRIGVQVLVWYV